MDNFSHAQRIDNLSFFKKNEISNGEKHENATAGREILRDRYRYRVISVKYKLR